jgi:carboxyl-terminal processing protease
MQDSFNFFKDRMKLDFNNRSVQAVFTSLLVAIVFFIGFCVGHFKADKVAAMNEDINNTDMIEFWQVWKVLDEKFAPASTTLPRKTTKERIWGATAGMTASLGDPYTVFFPPVESKIFGEQISGSFEGVGMELDTKDGILTVVTPIKGSPAERAGVKPGDKVIKVEDKVVANWAVGDVVKIIRGKRGTEVAITFAREGVNSPIVKTLIREAINIPVVNTKILADGTFVISLYTFTATSPNAFRGALREFVESGSDKLVLDLRNNPGGYLEAALDIASWFLPTGELVTTEKFGAKQDDLLYKSKGYNIFTDKLKFAILVNRGSASASEILAGALQQHHKAVVIGENSFGKGSVQELIDLAEGTSLKVTVAHWYTPNGTNISNGGLAPDIRVELTDENTKNGNDLVVERAVEYFKTGK